MAVGLVQLANILGVPLSLVEDKKVYYYFMIIILW